ncbi:nucleoplasmin-3 isoform X1 [Hemicordylus capensis]|uniref:nucleoplasmin-3 isoform X1 n=1 Tax=Hemicordylus capensis TaxID=884348 RepID=UPI002304B16E|nr:nucleoplasmin-3 isoform X1 [Hemicordylus capensis]
MADFLDLESVNEVEAPICTSSFLFGCELNSSARSYTFKVSEEDDSDHILALNTVCLSEGAKDECNIVEIVGRDYQNQEIAVPVANLKLSCQPWLNLDDFMLRPPVTFSLRSGSGPVHLAGQHQILHRKDLSDDEFSEEEEDFSEEDEFSEEEELSPIKPAKKQRKS